MARVTWLFAVLTAFLTVDAHSGTLDRYNHTATLLLDRSILTCGGVNSAGTRLDTCALLGENGVVAATPTPMTVARASHTATVLPNGRVLLAGGVDDTNTILASAEIYDPVTQTFSPTGGAMTTARYNHTATMLKTGFVLVCGGQPTLAGNSTDICDLYNPTTDTFVATANTLQAARARHTATLLRDGRVWIAGGYSQTSATPTLVTTELYVPSLDFFGAGKSLIVARADHTATVMGDGRVFVAGGHNGRSTLENQGYLDTTEIYDPISDSMVPAARMIVRRHAHSAVLMPTGNVVVYGGLGNITTSYLDDFNDALEATSFVTGNVLSLPEFPAVRIASASLLLNSQIKLGSEISGVIQSGDIFVSSGRVDFDGGIVYFRSGVSTTPAVGFRINLDGSNVGCLTASNCGNIDRDFAPADFPNTLAPGIQGSMHPDQLTPPLDNFSIADTHEIHFTGGVLAQGNPTVNLTSATISGTTRLRSLPLAFAGFAVLAGTFNISNLTFTQTSSWTVTATAGNFYLPAGTRIVVDPGDPTTAMTNSFTTTFQLTAGQITWGGADASQTFNSPLTTPMVATDFPAITNEVPNVAGISGSLNWTPSGATLTDFIFESPRSTIVVRTMQFSDVETFSPTANSWTPSIRMGLGSIIQSHRHVATLAPNGTMRIIGGRHCDPASRDVNCDTLTAVGLNLSYTEVPQDWLATSNLQTGPRGNHSATLLPDGRILVAGGTNGPNVLGTAELFNPATETFAQAGRMHHPRDLHTASLLTNGRVLVAGGFSTDALSTGATKTAEIFYPDTRIWLEASPMISSRSNHTAVVLPDGNVMVIGGFANGVYLDTTEIYYSTAGKWLPGPTMPGRRAQHSSTLMPDGRILVVGGLNASGILGSSYLLNTNLGTWAVGPVLAGGQSLHSHAATLMQDGRVMISGGNDEFGETLSSQIYTPGPVGTFAIFGELVVPRLAHSAHLLPNGDIFISGGSQAAGNSVRQSERYTIASSSWSLNSNYATQRSYGTVVLAADNTLYSIGGYDGSAFLNTSEKRFYILAHDQNTSFAPPSTREPIILSSDLQVVDRNQGITATGLNFMGNTEASGGGTNSSSHFYPRISMQRVADGYGGAAQGGSSFMIEMSTRIPAYPAPGNLWTKVDTSVTVVTPGAPLPDSQAALPYGWYHLRVGANAQFSDSRMIQAGPLKPANPATGLFAAALDTSTLNWTWTAPVGGGFDGYNIYSATTGVLITTRPVATDNSCTPHPCYVQRDLIPNASGQIIVAPYSLTGDGPLLQSSTRFTFASPVGLTLASTTADSVYLTWNSSGNRSGTVYEIQMSTDSFATIQVPVTQSDNYQGLFYTITPLTDNTIYSFRLRSYNGDGIPSGFSNVVSTRTRSPVNGLAGVALNTYQVQWSWLDPGGVTNYRVYNATTGALIATPASNLYIDTNLSTNSARSVNVSAVTGAGEGPLAPSVTVYTLSAIPLAANPPVINVTTGSLVVTYLGNQNPAGTRYVVEITSSGPLGITTVTTFGLLAGFQALDRPAEIWSLAVRSINEDDITSLPLVIGSTATLPQTPSALTVTDTGLDSISVIWSNGNNTSSATYQVTYTTDNFVNHVATAVAYSQGFTGDNLVISGLQTSTTYSIRVIAKNPSPFNRETVFSNIVTTRTSSGGAAIGSLAAPVPYQQNVTLSGTLGTTPPRFIKLDIPANTFPSDVTINVSSWALNGSGLCVAPNVSTTNVAIRITVDPPIQPVGKIFVTMEYAASEIGAMSTSRLSLLRQEPTESKCVPLMTSVNTTLRQVSAPLNHLSVFQLASLNPAASISGLRMFPNPWYASRSGFVTFHQLPADARVKIFTLRGELVHEFRSNNSGIVAWDGINRGGRKIASGVYFAVVDSGGDKRIMKLVVLK